MGGVYRRFRVYAGAGVDPTSLYPTPLIAGRRSEGTSAVRPLYVNVRISLSRSEGKPSILCFAGVA